MMMKLPEPKQNQPVDCSGLNQCLQAALTALTIMVTLKELGRK
jgi:hypothetical protein